MGAFVGLTLLASCSTDEYEPSADDSGLWKGELAAAPYANDAVCLLPEGATLGGETIKSIELTGSGLYFITYTGGTQRYKPASLKKANRKQTRDWLPEDVKSGNFTKLGANRYMLDGFGEVTINSDGTVNIELKEGGNYVWPVTKLDKIDDNKLNSRLCRTWNLVDGHVDFLNADLKVIYTMNISKKEMEEEYIYAIAFTLSGRVYRKDAPDEPWYGGTWRWSSTQSQLVEVHSDNPEDGEGIFQVLFDGDKMQVMNPTEFYDSDEARWEFSEISGAQNIPDGVRFAREYINLKAMN